MYRNLIKKYRPSCEQEQVDKQVMLDFISNNQDVLDRSNMIAHLTSSAIIVNEGMDKILFAYHNIYDSWAWVGGHNDGNPDVLEVAIKEAKEETGVINIRPFSDEILMIDVLPVQRHIKRGKFIPNHLHLNVTFLLIASEQDELIIKEDENSGVKWFNIDEVLNYVSEEEMKVVYKKAIKHINEIKNSYLYQR